MGSADQVVTNGMTTVSDSHPIRTPHSDGSTQLRNDEHVFLSDMVEDVHSESAQSKQVHKLIEKVQLSGDMILDLSQQSLKSIPHEILDLHSVEVSLHGRFLSNSDFCYQKFADERPQLCVS